MLGLLTTFLLAVVGIYVAYRFSPAAKLKARIHNALSPVEDLDADVRRLQETLRKEIESVAKQYVEAICTSRLRAIPVDGLKKYASGMRLQALKDAGIRTVADLQGWNEYRVSQVRGIGPKSASAIIHSVTRITASVQTVSIPHPSPPFSDDAARQLMQALYRQRWFDIHTAEQGTALATIVTSHQCARDAILARTKFGSWLWKFGSNATVKRSLEQAEKLLGALDDPSLQSIQQELSQSLNTCRGVCVNRVPVELIIEDYRQELAFYESSLTARLGPSNTKTPERLASQSNTEDNPMSDAVHVEFGRVVPGPPPQPTGRSPISSDKPHVDLRKPESLFTVAVGSTSDRSDAEFTLPPPPRLTSPSDLRWLKKGEPVQIQGQTLSHGFIYVSKGVDDEHHYVINPHLPALPGDSISADADGYYSSYSALSTERRFSYLVWLADGALSPTDSSFGMLYFYGIEHRLLDLLQNRVPNPSNTEKEELLQEVHRLGSIFKDKPGSVTQCCLRLSDFAAARALDGTSIPPLPKEWVKTWELPFVIRYGIGWFMKNRQPLPVEWALRWAYAEPTIYLRTPASRCPQEFEAAFATVYRKKFGEGLVIPANKTKLKLTYQPGWPVHFEQEIRHDCSGIPDIAAATGPQNTLKVVVEEATVEIDRYSRYLGRNPAKAGSLEAYINLPLYLWPSPATEHWRNFMASHVEPIQPVSLESLLRVLDPAEDARLSKAPEIAENLRRTFVGFEPDILAGARRPKPSSMIVLFPLTAESTAERNTPEYKKASLIISLAACVALADGHASEDEAVAVEEMIASWNHLHIDLRTRLRAQYRLQVRTGISLSNLKSRFANLTSEGRTQLALSLCSLAAADGNIAAAEVKLLEQIYRALELDSQLLYSHLHTGTKQEIGLESQRSSASSEPLAYTVDTKRLEALRRETEQVSALLAEVFVEEEPTNFTQAERMPAKSQNAISPENVLLPGLDLQHEQFLAQLLSKATWARQELQTVAAGLQIMLDGALERINDAAFDLVGEPITEGDDPIFVQQNILEATE